MTISVELNGILRDRGLTAKELSARIGITEANLSRLRTGKANAIRFQLLDALCREIDCQPGDILKYCEREELRTPLQRERPFEEENLPE